MRTSTSTLLALAALLAVPVTASVGGSWAGLGPEGASIGRLAVDPSNPLIVFATAGDRRPLYRSTDGGATWSSAGLGLPENVGPVAVAAGSARVYAIGSEKPPDDSLHVFRSTDGGSTFAEVGSAQALSSVGGLVAHPNDVDTVYLFGQPTAFDIGDYGLLRSTDGGGSWSGLEFVDRSVVSMVFDTGDATHLFVTSSRGPAVHRSTDGGATWDDVTTGKLPATQWPLAVGWVPSAPPALLVGTTPIPPETVGEIHRSTDLGETWSPAATPPHWFTMRIVASNATDVYAIEVFASRLLRSSDGGASWEAASFAPPVERMVFDLAATPTQVFAADFSEGVARSEDRGETWQAGSGFRSARVGGLAVSPDDPAHLWAAVGSTVHRSTDGGDSWSVVGHSPAGVWMTDVTIDPDAGATLVAADRSIVRSTDGGVTWSETLPWSEVGSTRHNMVARDPFDAEHLLTVRGASMGDDEVHASTDGGATWTPIATLPDGAIDLTFDPTAMHRVFAVGSGGTHRSTDGGATWTPLAPEHLGTPLAFSTLVVDPRDGAFYGASTAVYRSIDAGDTWSPTAAIGDSVTAWLADGTSLYAGTGSSGVFSTDDGGASWQPLAGGQALPSVNVLASAPGVLYAGTDGAGVVRLTAADTLFCDGFESGNVSAWSPD